MERLNSLINYYYQFYHLDKCKKKGSNEPTKNRLVTPFL